MGIYNVILADPPWPYQQDLGRGKGAGDTTRGGLPYKTMTIQEIENFPVQRLCSNDSMLFLWSTNAHLHEALHVVERWGFRYKTTITWGKTHFGLGYWFRGQTEHILFGVKGKPRKKLTGPHGATGKAWSTLFIEKRSEHSKKPEVVYRMIEDISEPPRLELFARSKREGWDSWGDEVPDRKVLSPYTSILLGGQDGCS